MVIDKSNANILPGNDIKLYRRRWLLMFLFMFYTVSSGVHWVEFSSISNIMSSFYQVSELSIQWTTIMNSVVIVVLVFPLLYLQYKVGLKYFLMLAVTAQCIGSTIKLFSAEPDKFYLVLIGQMFTSMPIVFTSCLIGRFTATWFGNKEISRASALTLVGDQMGGALSFLLPNMFVKTNPDQNVVRNDLLTMNYFYAGAAYLTLFLIVVFFREQPKLPPSISQALKVEHQAENVWRSLLKAFSNPIFIAISIMYGLIVSACQTISTFLNTFVEKNFHGQEDETGVIGCLLLLSGMTGSVIVSYILDRTRKFKENVIILCGGSTISLMLAIISLKSGSILYFYGSTILLGFFTMSMYATGIQMGIEATYPLSEEIVAAIMLLSTQAISTLTNLLFGPALQRYGDVICLSTLDMSLLISTILSCIIPPDLLRENTEQSKRTVEMKEFLPRNGGKEIAITRITVARDLT